MANKMKCEYCQNQPEYICDCCIIFCQPHIPKHREECQKFKIGVIKESDKVRILSIILFRRIQKINQISWEIVQNTQNLISTIENLCKNSVSKLESIKQTSSKIDSVDSKYADEIANVFHRINEIDQNINEKNGERKKESEEIFTKVSEAKSLIDSKVESINQLTKNLDLYSNEKTSINERIDQLYEELSDRVMKS